MKYVLVDKPVDYKYHAKYRIIVYIEYINIGTILHFSNVNYPFQSRFEIVIDKIT